jgi:hypothetical protein
MLMTSIEYYPIVKIPHTISLRLRPQIPSFWRGYLKVFPYFSLFAIGIIIVLFFFSLPIIFIWALAIVLFLGAELYLWGSFTRQKFPSFVYLEPISPSTARKGMSETYFFEILQSVFGDCIRWGGTYCIPDWEEKYWYSSDIELIWQDLAIQIEIDEPYVGKSKKPHHCCDLDADRQRDIFFTNGNWIVVRFSEKQVVEYPYRSCAYLVKILFKLKAARLFFIDEDLSPDPRWTVADSLTMATEDYRLSYLKAVGLWRK